jgi:glycosyltransferase involved in cell wall biosynthesis
MAAINFIVPPVSEKKFSGGLLCIFEYAHGLFSRGHDVRVIPVGASPYPRWFSKPIGRFIHQTNSQVVYSAAKSVVSSLPSVLSGRHRMEAVRNIAAKISYATSWTYPDLIKWGISEHYVSHVAPDSDINIATSFETVRPTVLLKGRKFYFMQHFEPLFAEDFSCPEAARATARQSYDAGLHLVANSSWLQKTIREETGHSEVSLCPNAIDHDNFNGTPERGSASSVAVISYGGRGVEWKGFREMAEAVAIARKLAPEVKLEWRVYGDAKLEPNNSIAEYKPLGFLSQERLADEYRKADILLSASWYESFPLFPLEAMASGLAVITTQLGTEEYAIHETTAEVVEPKSPASIADGLLRLIRDPEYRYSLAQRGNEVAHQFTWNRSVARLEQILLEARSAAISKAPTQCG